MEKFKKTKKVIAGIGTTLTMLAIKSQCFATEGSGSIGTAEVTTATENIKRVITSIAMPLRWSFSISALYSSTWFTPLWIPCWVA